MVSSISIWPVDPTFESELTWSNGYKREVCIHNTPEL